MPSLIAERFSFVSSALPKGTFGVVHFKGSEGLSQCYQFDVTLISEDPRLDLEKVLDSPAVFTVYHKNGDSVPFNGIIAQFEQMQQTHDYIFYRARLAPKLWWLTQTHHHQVFLNQTIPQILEAVLQAGGLTSLDYELRLQGDYTRPWEFVCQYRESHFHFFCRWLEWAGIYFFFEQTEAGEKLIITDSKIAHVAMPPGLSITYAPPSGMEEAAQEGVIQSFICRQKKSPRNILVKDYNYRRSALDLTGKADVSPNGIGDVFLYGEHFQTPDEGNRLAQIRAEELLCRQKMFVGESRVPYLRPGYVFNLNGHYRQDFNDRYMTTEIEHEGNQAAYLAAGLREALSDREKEPFYRNSFTALPAQVQFRPERLSEKPRIHGSMNAKIDASGSGQYAELDQYGRYKVLLPFDLSGRRDGKASAWLRMSQPYAGSDHGMHFPLHKGTEVLLTFIDGDPDRPIIAGAVPNPETPSMVHSANATRAGFQTAGGGSFHFEDQDGKQKAVMHAGDGSSVLSMGQGSPPQWLQKSDLETVFTSLISSSFSGFSRYSIVGSKDTLAVGWTKFGLLMLAIAEFFKGIPKLTHAAAKEAGASDSDQKWAEGIATLAMPVIALVVNIVQGKMIEKWIVNRFKNTTGQPESIPDKPLFFVGGLGEGSIMQMDKSGRHICLYAEDGDIFQLGMNISLSSTDRASINAQYADLEGAQDVKIQGHHQIVLEQKELPFARTLPPYDGIKISSAKRNININSKSGQLLFSEGKKTEVHLNSDNKVVVGVPTSKENSFIEVSDADGITITTPKKFVMHSEGNANLNSDQEVILQTKNNKITMSGDTMVILGKESVKIMDLQITKDSLSYDGKSATICKALKIK